MPTQISHLQHAAADQDQQKHSLDKRLAVLFWALLFILAGTIWLFPAGRVPEGTWLVGIGLILLSLNAVRLLSGIPVRVLPTLLGALALVAGLAEYAGMELPVFSLTLIAIGASIILELLSTRRT
jgi:hypothetical protein